VADCQVSAGRHGYRQPRARQYERVDDSAAVDEVYEMEGHGRVLDLVPDESVRNETEAEQEVGHGKCTQADVHRSLRAVVDGL